MASYRVEVTDQARREIRHLPGNMRQRVIRLLQTLRQQPRPDSSQTLDTANAGIHLPAQIEPRRIRLEAWRVVYVVEEEEALVTVLAVRKRPPYQYEDLEDLIQAL